MAKFALAPMAISMAFLAAAVLPVALGAAPSGVSTKLPLNTETYDKTRTYWADDMKLDQTKKSGGERDAGFMIYIPCGVSCLFAFCLWFALSFIKVERRQGSIASEASFVEIKNCYETIQTGAKAFLKAEYTVCTGFILIFAIIIWVLTSRMPNLDPTTKKDLQFIWQYQVGGLTAASFFVGAFTSMFCGYLSMMVAVGANAKVAIAALEDGAKGWTGAFNTAFRAGAVTGFASCGIAIAVLYSLCLIFRDVFTAKGDDGQRYINYKYVFECVSGYGLGGSTIALFGRVGGGIFTKAADVGADLSGKVIGLGDGKKLDEDSPFNPAVIADNVGDNVGDVAGMGSDLFGSLAEASCAAMLLGSSIEAIEVTGWAALMYPLYISSIGALTCMVMHFVATDVMPVRKEEDIETVLKIQLLGTALIVTGVMYPVTVGFLPDTMTIQGVFLGETLRVVTSVNIYGCVLFGVWAGTIIGFITEYYTSHSYTPTRDVARASETGAATVIIYGVALGYLSSIIPVGLIAGTVYFCWKTSGLYGVAIGALGMLSTLATGLSIDVYGPISDNAGGVAEMSEFPPSCRDKTDALDAAGNTTAAIGKGFAIGSAALVSVSLTGAFVVRVSTSQDPSASLLNTGVNLMSAVVWTALIIGANIPYWFSALTMKSVGIAANAMVREVGRQWAEIPGLKDSATMDFETRAAKYAKGEKLVKPDYAKCIAIATNASLIEMIAPACLVLCCPIIVGAIFGVEAVVGFLAGAMSSAIQMAISMSNTGGAWDNAKKYCEKGELNGWFIYRDGKGGDEKAFKDTAKNPEGHGDMCLVVPNDKASNQTTNPTPMGSATLMYPVNTAPVYSLNMSPPPAFNPMPMPIWGNGVPMQPMQMNMYPMGGQMIMGSAMGAHDSAPMKFKDWLAELGKTDAERYRKIMAGEEGVPTYDGRMCVYAGKRSNVHAACVVGDTVGDPFKDTSGPALNIVMKLMAIISVVFADFFMSINNGNGAAFSGNIHDHAH